jgi:hypothetical protein
VLKPVSIRTCWPFVQEGLEEVKRLRGGTWRNEDVYADCVHGKAYLWLSDDGFVIFKAETDEYSGLKILIVWFAWGKANVDLIDKYQDQIVGIGKEQEFDIIRFYRNAKGPVEFKGWKKTYTIYDMEL